MIKPRRASNDIIFSGSMHSWTKTSKSYIWQVFRYCRDHKSVTPIGYITISGLSFLRTTHLHSERQLSSKWILIYIKNSSFLSYKNAYYSFCRSKIWSQQSHFVSKIGVFNSQTLKSNRQYVAASAQIKTKPAFSEYNSRSTNFQTIHDKWNTIVTMILIDAFLLGCNPSFLFTDLKENSGKIHFNFFP